MTILWNSSEQTSATAAAGSGMKRFAIIDAAPDPLRTPDYLPEIGEPVRLVPTPHHDPDAMPWLLPLEAAHDPWLRSRREETGWGIVVESRLGMMELYQMLASKLVVLDTDRVESLFRYYDPIVSRALLPRFTAQELEDFFAGISRLGLVDRERTDWMLPSGGSGVAPGTSKPLELRREHLDRLSDHGDRILKEELKAFIDYERPDAFSGLAESTVNEMLVTAITKSRHYGLTTAADIATFTAIMFDVAPNFDQQPQIAACLSNRQLPAHLRLRAAVTECDEAAWQDAEDRANPEAWFRRDFI